MYVQPVPQLADPAHESVTALTLALSGRYVGLPGVVGLLEVTIGLDATTGPDPLELLAVISKVYDVTGLRLVITQERACVLHDDPAGTEFIV